MKDACVQVYTGDGKGKTTAALGLALRAAGHGLTTYMGQFMKGQSYGELEALRDPPLIRIEQYGGARCLRREEISGDDIASAKRGLERAREVMLSEKPDIVVLGEVNVALWFGLLSLSEVSTFLDERPESVEMVLTGRRAPAELVETADLVTEMVEVKHYYRRGVPARAGVER